MGSEIPHGLSVVVPPISRLKFTTLTLEFQAPSSFRKKPKAKARGSQTGAVQILIKKLQYFSSFCPEWVEIFTWGTEEPDKPNHDWHIGLLKKYKTGSLCTINIQTRLVRELKIAQVEALCLLVIDLLDQEYPLPFNVPSPLWYWPQKSLKRR